MWLPLFLCLHRAKEMRTIYALFTHLFLNYVFSTCSLLGLILATKLTEMNIGLLSLRALSLVRESDV